MSFKVGDRVRILNRSLLDLGDGIYNSEIAVVSAVESGRYPIRVLPDNRADAYDAFLVRESEIELLESRQTLSDGSERVVFSVAQGPTIQIAFSDKPLLELTPVEATQLLRQLDAVIL